MQAASTAHRSLTPTPGRYSLDPTRTTIAFRTRHMFGLGVVTGGFKLRGGHVDVAESISECSVRAAVSADSIDTGHPTRDRMVRSSTYLDTGKHPDIEFTASLVRPDDEGWIVDGTLVAHGVATPVQVTIHDLDATRDEIRLHASAKVDRYAHGIKAGRGIAGRRLTIDIVAVAARQ